MSNLTVMKTPKEPTVGRVIDYTEQKTHKVHVEFTLWELGGMVRESMTSRLGVRGCTLESNPRDGYWEWKFEHEHGTHTWNETVRKATIAEAQLWADIRSVFERIEKLGGKDDE